MRDKQYLGWILTRGNEVYVSVSGNASEIPMGQGEKGAVKAVEYFDKLAGQKIQLEDLPLGFRVFKQGVL